MKNVRNDQKRAKNIAEVLVFLQMKMMATALPNVERKMANLNIQTPEKSPYVKVLRKIYTFMEDMYRKLVCLLLV